MKKILILLSLLHCFASVAFAQESFEGEVTYAINIKSNLPKITDEQFSKLLGTQQLFYMKGANYKSLFNGTYAQWSIYVDKDKKLYDKTSVNDSILWHDVSLNHDTIYKVELHKKDTVIMGYNCDKLILTCNSGLQIYYFNAELAVDPELYINHQEGNWYAFLKISKSIALKEIIYRRQLTFTLTATAVKRTHIEDSLFKLSPGVPLAESWAKL